MCLCPIIFLRRCVASALVTESMLLWDGLQSVNGLGTQSLIHQNAGNASFRDKG